MTSLVCSDPSKMVYSDPPRMDFSDPYKVGGSLQTILEGSLQTKDVIDGAGCSFVSSTYIELKPGPQNVQDSRPLKDGELSYF